jgi:hypothetical protein
MVGRPYVPSFFTRAFLHGPPQTADEEQEEMPHTVQESWREIIAGLIGLTLILASEVGGQLVDIRDDWVSPVKRVLLALGIAFLTAGVLAYIVDRPLRDKIAQTAFRKIMGWVSFERLQTELEWVYQQSLLAVDHHMRVDLSETTNGFMRVTLDIERRIKNESLQSQKLRPSASVRDWQDPGRMSEVTEIAALFKGIRYDEREPADGPDEEATDLKWEQLTEELTLAPGEEMTSYFIGHEDKLLSDVHWQVFIAPTLNPTVVVSFPTSFNVYVQFGSRGNRVCTRISDIGNKISKQWELEGTMLPVQPIFIRWWPKDAKPNSE